MKIGTQVKMVNCCEARKNPDKVWVTRSEPWELGHGQKVVLLEGKTGGFSLDCLKEVKGDWKMKPCYNCVGGRNEMSWVENGKVITKDIECEVCKGTEEISISEYEDYIENMALAKQVKERFEFGEEHGLYNKR